VTLSTMYQKFYIITFICF